MSPRHITKLFCPSNHRIGTVGADDDGLLVEYTAEVWHTGGMFGAPATNRLTVDEVMPTADGDQAVWVAEEFGGYCNQCKRPVTLPVRQLWSAGKAHQKDLKLGFADSTDAVWRKSGHERMYPQDMPRHKRDPR